MDNLLAISLDKGSIIFEVADKLKLKKDKIDQPALYLGSRISNKPLNGQEIWTISRTYYVKVIINNIEVRLKKEGTKLPERAETPMSFDYNPGLDATAELESCGITMYQELILELR